MCDETKTKKERVHIGLPLKSEHENPKPSQCIIGIFNTREQSQGHFTRPHCGATLGSGKSNLIALALEEDGRHSTSN